MERELSHQFIFAYPWLLLALLILPWLLYRQYRLKKSSETVFKFSSLQGINKQASLKAHFLNALPLFRIIAIGCLIVALARPQTRFGIERLNSNGIDIILATDLSGSMLAQDFRPNRMEAAKKVVYEFINNRPADRIGLVVFAGESFTLSPLTTDHRLLKELILKVTNGQLQDGTAIGMGLATSVERLKESKAKGKVIILLTDGVNNSGFIAPMTAAELAKKFGIKIYTIGVGSKLDYIPFPGGNNMGELQVDEALLNKISEMTGGKYFRATNNDKLRHIYEEIDKLETVKIESSRYLRKKEAFFPWIAVALLFLSMEFSIRYFFIKSIT